GVFGGAVEELALRDLSVRVIVVELQQLLRKILRCQARHDVSPLHSCRRTDVIPAIACVCEIRRLPHSRSRVRQRPDQPSAKASCTALCTPPPMTGPPPATWIASPTSAA